MPQVPQSPVNTAPTPVNTTQSPDSFSSFSTQPSRPIAPPHMPTYGSSFSRPTVGRPSFPAPHPIDQPINPMAPNGITNVSQMPSSTFPSSDQVVFSDTGATSATSSGKGKKIAIIILLLFLVAGGVVAALFATGVLGGSKSTSNAPESSNTPSTKEEIYNVLWEYDTTYYSHLIEEYNESIGIIPDFKMSETDILFPAETYANALLEKVNSAIAAYNDNIDKLPNNISNSNIDIFQAKVSIKESLQAIKQNSDLIEKFYNAYIAPIFDKTRPSTCSKTPDMLNLEQNNTVQAADKYYMVYCEALAFANSTGDIFAEATMSELKRQVSVATTEAANSLNSILIEVPSATNTVNNTLEELTK